MELDNEHLREFICEVCDKHSYLTDHEAYNTGWDYPPFMGVAGIISARTCGDCGIDKTVWWDIMLAQQTGQIFEPNEHQIEIIKRILAEVQ